MVVAPAIMPGYNIESTLAECSNGGTTVDIKEGLNYKLMKGLAIYKSKELESIFMEINLNNKKVVINCTYRYSSMELTYRYSSMELSEFNSEYLTNLLDTLSSEKQNCSFTSDFKVDILKYD